ncbi:hypothetical protein BDA96_07G103600 [Sorghum bicolor]|uniref:Uncharacterized protein n=2 Tax=Sorghum bicolor TaxID=4558 RepID=A0A921QJA7_SORBI|nr:hypothetical protein BDA96_07G103600 [Sorghum bicolor]OQU80222.1 hypothetical protein SORBI_3007G097201 [Sorghum bicolor]
MIHCHDEEPVSPIAVRLGGCADSEIGMAHFRMIKGLL